MVALEGPFVVGEGGLPSRMIALASGDSLSMLVTGTGVGGDYMLAIGGRSSPDLGEYTLTIGPAAP